MRVSVVGTGYLGATHAAALAELGHTVVGIDVDEAQIKQLQAGEVPFYEPELAQSLAHQVDCGALRFSTDMAEASDAEVHFVCVGTPQQCDGDGADLSYLEAAIETLCAHTQPGQLVAGRSTVPVGTAERLRPQVEAAGADLVWNPEFLREGYALEDCLRPNRIVVGAVNRRAADRLLGVYDRIVRGGAPVVLTDYATAELVKVAANAFLATKVSFVNAMAELCERTGADVQQLSTALGYDSRIGASYLQAGLGYGGSCLPKDLRALSARAAELDVPQIPHLLRAVDAINLSRRDRLVALAEQACAGSVAGRTIGVLGLAFKPNSDDIRDSPALDVATTLARRGAHVQAHDPRAMPRVAEAEPAIRLRADACGVCREADLLLVLTDWPHFARLDPSPLGALMRRRMVIDARNVLPVERWRSAGWAVRTIGGSSRPITGTMDCRTAAWVSLFGQT